MRRALRLLLPVVSLAVPAFPGAARAEPLTTDASSCADGVCSIRLTGAQLLAEAERVVVARDFDAARPMLAALANAPEHALERHFLAGYVAAETGDLDGAIGHFRAILRDDPKQTRVRLELARAMMLKGNDFGADHHFRLAEQDGALPPEVAATIRSSRGIIRDRRTWHFNFDMGFAPDSNINNATSADTIDVVFGNDTIPLKLDAEARARSGVGQTGGFSGGFRFRLSPKLAMLIDGDGQMVNYEGETADDFAAQLAVGPEFRFSEATSLSLQAIGSRRWYGGKLAADQVGVKAGVQTLLDSGQRIGLQVDARHTNSGFSPVYDGWQMGAYATYERVVGRSMIASASLFARRDSLRSKAYSNREAGFNLGIGGEFPWGLNAGVSGGASRASFDAPLAHFSPDEARKDWRMNGRAYVGLRTVRLLGFSPSLSYGYSRADSTYDFYRTDRHRVRFNLARYF